MIRTSSLDVERIVIGRTSTFFPETSVLTEWKLSIVTDFVCYGGICAKTCIDIAVVC